MREGDPIDWRARIRARRVRGVENEQLREELAAPPRRATRRFREAAIVMSRACGLEPTEGR